MQTATLNQESKTVSSREGRPSPPRLTVPADASLTWCWENLGWRYVCLNGKKPVESGRTGKNIKEVTPLDSILAHLGRGGNVGILTGSHSGGLLVVDYDPGSELPDPLPNTLISNTGRSGLHVYYRMPVGITIANSASKLAPHVDTRGDGGYVVCPPSLHPNDVRYSWVEGHAPGDCNLAELPMEIASVLLKSGKRSNRRAKEVLSEASGNEPPRELNDGVTASYLKRELESAAVTVRCAPSGTRNDTLNKVAYTLGRLSQSGLSQEVVRAKLLEAALAAGLLAGEAKATFDSGWESGTLKPRLLGAQEGESSSKHFASSETFTERRIFDRDDVRLYAADLLEERFTRFGRICLRRWRDEWWEWGGTRYLRILEEAMKGIACEYISCRVGYLNAKSEISLPKPTASNTNNVLQALYSMPNVLVPNPEAGIWLDNVRAPSNAPLLPVVNGLLDVSTRTLYPHSPSYLNTYALSYEYEAVAPKPTSWLAFLDSLWGNDQESIDTLQEWFGYVLSGETSFQKILLLIGPKRAGKGTIARVLTELMGAENVCNPTLADLGSNFGLQVFIDKSLAIFGDARMGARQDVAVAVERMLSISGEDAQTVDRKYKEHLTTRLPSRLMIVSNELPRINDASGAFASRLVTLQARNSFLGKEDLDLPQKLKSELPGILHWGLEGMDRLKRCGRFTEPASAQSMVETFADLSSPISAFVRERCILEAAARVRASDLYTVWLGWCNENGIDKIGSTQALARDLYSSFPEITKERSSINGDRDRYYTGIRVKK
jgi:putative DNA primase/helicase